VETARALGAWYTPGRLAETLCRWAVRRPTDTVLDPSCGDGAFLAAARARVVGIDVDPSALDRAARAAPGAGLIEDDFFAFARANLGRARFDAVVGNPPFLRTQGRAAAEKRRALAVAAAAGVRLTADASTWAPFVAASAALVRPGGRLAMIVPREALFVGYARPLLEALTRRFARTELVALDASWFEGALVKVALLRSEGTGPGTLAMGEERRANPPGRPWVWSRLPADCRAAAARAMADPALRPLTDLVTLSIGIVTGDAGFFVLAGKDARRLRLPRRFLRAAVSRPAELAGSTLARSDADGLGRLLVVPPGYDGGCAPLDAYLAEGEARGLPARYKCRTRRPWYAVRRVLEPPDAFLGYLVKRRPRLAANGAAAVSTNNLHRLWFRAPADAALVAAASYNAATMLSVELVGRVAAGGVLKIEPGDAPKIRLVDPELLATAPRSRERAGAIDRLLRERRDDEAFSVADGLAADALGWDAREMATLRRAARVLRDARLAPRPPGNA
jgi:hypothetical protein